MFDRQVDLAVEAFVAGGSGGYWEFDVAVASAAIVAYPNRFVNDAFLAALTVQLELVSDEASDSKGLEVVEEYAA